MSRHSRVPSWIAAPMIVLVLAFAGDAAPQENPALTATSTHLPVQREIKVTAKQFEFSPRTITVRKGERIRLSITSEDVDHGIAISEFGIDQQVPARQTRVIELTPDKEGRFRIHCSVFCGDGHPDMTGELIVTSEQASAPSNMQVTFDKDNPAIVYVESNGERIRIDTGTKTVATVRAPAAPAPAPDAVAMKERESSKAYEPYDYRLINVPTPRRVRKNSFNVYFTHRFSEPINDEGAEDLFGLDGYSISSLGFQYGITDRLYANFYRSPYCDIGICKTIEIGLGYHLLDEAGRSPIALSAYASVEGEDNFTEEYTYNIQAMVARSVTRYVNLFFAPAIHINANGSGRFLPRGPAANDISELGEHTGSFGFGVNARVRPTTSLLFEYTPRVGFKLGQVGLNDDFTRFEYESRAAIGFGVEKRIGRHSFALTFSNTQLTTTSRYNSSNLALPASKFIIGFNLGRRLF